MCLDSVYRGVSDLLECLDFFVSKTTVYNNVQAAGSRAIQLRRQWVAQHVGQVKCARQDCIVAVATAFWTGQPLTFNLLAAEGAVRVEQWVRELGQTIGAEVVVTGDADGMKIVAEPLGLQHQVCRAHVNRNVHDLISS